MKLKHWGPIACGVALCACTVSTPITPAPDARAPDARAPRPCESGATVWPERNSPLPEWGSGRTLTYALSSLLVDPTQLEPTDPIAGFDLDEHIDGDEFTALPMMCTRIDALSDLDCDQNCNTENIDRDGRCVRRGCWGGRPCIGGVDNQLPAVLDVLDALADAGFSRVGSRAVIERVFQQAHASVIVQVSAVESLEEDPSVRVRLLRAVPLFAPPCDATTLDQRYAIDARSVIAGDPQRPVIADAVGSIHRRRLRVRFDGAFAFPLIDAGPSLRDWSVRSPILAADLSEAALSEGNFGATIDGEQIARAFSTDADGALFGAAFSDLSADGALRDVCSNRTACPPTFGRVSVGARFAATRATLTDRVLSAPLDGLCPARGAFDADAGTHNDGSLCVSQ
ncbi:MAG: hypothetical protein U0269_26705 [Polyangiales bacterium]